MKAEVGRRLHSFCFRPFNVFSNFLLLKGAGLCRQIHDKTVNVKQDIPQDRTDVIKDVTTNQDRRDARQGGRRTGQMKDRRDAGRDGCRTAGMKDANFSAKNKLFLPTVFF